MVKKSLAAGTLAALVAMTWPTPAAAQSAPEHRWSVSFGAGVTPTLDGVYHEGGTGTVLALPTKVEPRDWSEIYDNGFTMRIGVGYAFAGNAEVTGAFRYARQDADELSVGTVAGLDLRSAFGNYRDWGVEGGLRWHFTSDAPVAPFVGVSAGMRRVEAMPATFSVPAANVVLSGTPFYDESTVPTFGPDFGIRFAVAPRVQLGLEAGLRWTGDLSGLEGLAAELKVLGVHIDGGMRPEIVVPARKLHRSRTLSYDQLALVETLGIGAHAVERAQIGPDDFVLVIGAGPIGLSVIQFAVLHGPTLAVMDVRASRLEFCRRQFGISHTLAGGRGTQEELRGIGGGELPTVVIDATGNAASMAATFDLPAQGGRIVFVGLFQGDVGFSDPNFHRCELTLLASRNAQPHNFRDIIASIESGRIDTAPWITHRFGLADTPERFPEIASDPSVIKTVIDV